LLALSVGLGVIDYRAPLKTSEEFTLR
jgi:hypothetical protein